MGITNGQLTDIGDITGIVSLPTGASTEAKQDTGNASLASIDGNVIKSDTDNVTVIASSLPSGASTEAKQDAGNASLVSLDSKLNSLGQKASADSVPVVLSSDQSAIAIKSAPGTLTNRSGTAGTTTSQAMPANPNRKYLLVQNNSSKKLYINFTDPATTGGSSILIPANGGSFVMEGLFVTSEAVNIISDANGTAYSAKEG